MVGGNYVIGVIYLVICVVELRGNRYTRGDVAWSLSAEIFDLISLPVTQQNLVEGELNGGAVPSTSGSESRARSNRVGAGRMIFRQLLEIP